MLCDMCDLACFFASFHAGLGQSDEPGSDVGKQETEQIKSPSSSLGQAYKSDLNRADLQVWLARSETAPPATGAVLDRGWNWGSAAFGHGCYCMKPGGLSVYRSSSSRL